jgi:TRAP-type transport system small permease protein
MATGRKGSGMRRAFDLLDAAISRCAIVLLAVMVILIGSQVFARYVLNQALYWTEELGRHVMIWMVFLAAAVCLRRGFHLSITILAQRLSDTGRTVLRLLVGLTLAGFFMLMISEGYTLAAKTMVQRSSALHYPMGLVYASLPVCGVFLFLFNLEQLVGAVRSFGRRPRSARPPDRRSEGE